MEIRFNVTGAERKALVAAISEITGWAAVYQKAPSFAYTVQTYTIGKNGTLLWDERMEPQAARLLLDALAQRGFVSEDSLEDEAPDADAPDRLSIEVPLEGFTETMLANLEKLVASKSTLLRKAVGADSLPIRRKNDRICFSWFPLGSKPEETAAYTQLVTALSAMVKTQKRVTATEKPADNEKFAFRCFLLRLGFIGPEYASARKILLRKLSGDPSFKSGKRRDSVPKAPQDADTGVLDAGADAFPKLADDTANAGTGGDTTAAG